MFMYIFFSPTPPGPLKMQKTHFFDDNLAKKTTKHKTNTIHYVPLTLKNHTNFALKKQPQHKKKLKFNQQQQQQTRIFVLGSSLGG